MTNYIKELEIKSFRALKNVKYDNIGLVNKIYGKNGSGKTTTIEAINWVLSGETLDYGGTDELNINDLNPNEILDVKLTLSQGQTLQRKYGNKIQDNGNETLINYFYVNDVKCKNQKDYFDCVCKAFNLNYKTQQKLNLISCFINPYKFSLGVDSKILRKFIEELLNINIDKIVFDTGKFSKIIIDYNMQFGNFNNLIESYNKGIKNINANIDNANAVIGNNDVDFDENELENLKVEKRVLQQNYKPFDNPKLHELSNLYIEKKKELAQSQSDDILNNTCQEEKDIAKELVGLKNEYNSNVDKYNSAIATSNFLNTKLETTKNSLELTENLLKETKESSFETIICPHCNGIVNENGLNDFNEKKANKIKEINATIEAKKTEIENLTKEKNANDLKVDDLIDLLSAEQKQLSKLKSDLEKIKKDPNRINKSQKTIDLEKIVETTEIDLAKLKEQYEMDKANYNNDYNNKLNEIETKINALLISKEKKSFITKAIDEKRKLLKEKEELENKIVIAKEFKKVKIQETKKQLSKIFGDDLDFEFIKEYKTSDNFKEVCYATLKGIKYSSMNTANKLKIGILIIKKLKEYIGGCDLPIVFDISDNLGNEALNNIISNANTQLFFTSVDKEDKEERSLCIVKEIK